MIGLAGEKTIEIKIVEYDSGIRKIGVVSDTHIPTRGRHLPQKLYELFADVQLILHAGDLVDEIVIDELKVLAPVEAVAGNMDPLKLHNQLGKIKLISLGEVNIGLLHGDVGSRRVDYSRISDQFKPARLNAVVFGHLHEPLVRIDRGILYFNPGSAVDPRREPKPSCGRLLIEGSQISGEILYL